MGSKLEVCVDSLASARAAIAGGADRLELCSVLCCGGLTPHADLLRQIRKESNIELRCMIRPRPGDFLYSPEEIQLMLLQIWHLRQIGADGFAFGCLDEEGYLDQQALCPLIEAAQEKKLTLNRAFDGSRDLLRSYEVAASLGFSTVLTSGGEATCMKGRKTIGKLLDLHKKQGGPEVMVGSGIRSDVIHQLRKELPEVKNFHMSGKVPVESRMKFRKNDLAIGMPGMDEWHIYVTSEEEIRQAKIEMTA